MKAIIFKNENKAKVYKIYSTKDQGPYRAGELIEILKTDNINEIVSDRQYQVTYTEVV